MMYFKKFSVFQVVALYFVFACLLALTNAAYAAGMKPDTTIVLINAADGEGSINVSNTDDKAALLSTSLTNIAEDQEDLLFVTPPIARVEAGETQLVRFILQGGQPITTQRLKRVTFEGITQKEPGATNVVAVNVRQNIPVVIHPAGLAMKNDPWVLLKWSRKGNTLNVTNDSPYVVRMSRSLVLLPGNTSVDLTNNYVLPGQSLNVDLPAGSASAPITSVKFTPASLYGFSVEPFTAALN